MSDLDVLKRSVTKDDHPDARKDGGVRILIPFAFGDTGLLPGGLPPELPRWWCLQRDMILRATVQYEGMWGSAVGIRTTKLASLGWEIDCEVPMRVSRVKDLLTYSDLGNGWVSFLSKLDRDHSTTDNGAFFEVIHATSARGSRIIGLVHLDSLRCERTGDPSIPVVYRDKLGAKHELNDYQVRCFADMPDPGETWNGVGLCAASRAYKAIVKLAAMDQFLIEKTTGRRALELVFIGGLSPQTLNSIVASAEDDANARGIKHYMGVIMAAIGGDVELPIARIPLAEIPNGFERKEEWDIALLTFADALGLDPQDLQPLTGQPLGTGAQSRTLDNKAKGKGAAAFRQALTHALNEFVLSSGTTFAFTERDFNDQKQEAEISQMRVDRVGTLIENGIINPQQAAQILVDEDELPDTILPQGDLTPDTQITDADGKTDDEPTELLDAAPTPLPVDTGVPIA